MDDNISIDKATLTADTVQKCVEVYPDIVRAVYKATRPKLNQAQILENDRWRYDLSAETESSGGISKDELTRLVQWKITHGIHRPFLPGMVSKNSPEDVKTCTIAAAKILQTVDGKGSQAETMAAVNKALAEACKLKGVGPATGTLILSIFKPHIVPFFQDETYYWVTSDYSTKLKYDKKEYATVLENILGIAARLNVDAIDLEKAAYVLSHTDKLNDEQREQLKQGNRTEGKSVKISDKITESKNPKAASNATAKRKRPVSRIEEVNTTPSEDKDDVDVSSIRRSKRKKA